MRKRDCHFRYLVNGKCNARRGNEEIPIELQERIHREIGLSEAVVLKIRLRGENDGPVQFGERLPLIEMEHTQYATDILLFMGSLHNIQKLGIKRMAAT